jgi:hypothetical protein
MIGATVAVAQVSGEFIQDRLIRIAPEEGSEELRSEPFPGEDNVVEAPKHWIGLAAGQVPDLLRKHLQLGESAGVLVLSVVEDSPAAAAGITKDDVVLSAAGKQLADPRDLIEVVREQGEKGFEMELIHEGERASVQVTPAERPEEYSVAPFEQNEEGNVFRIVPDDMPQVRQWLENLPRGEGLRFRSMGPGMLFDNGQLDLRSLPNGLSVQVHKEGDAPAKVKVQQGDQNWEFEANDKQAIEQLPEDVRNAVEGMLGGGSFSLRNGDVLKQLEANLPDGAPAVVGDEFERRMKEMESRIEELVEELGRLQSEK